MTPRRPPEAPFPAIVDRLRSMWRVRPSLLVFACLMAILAIFFVIGIAADGRAIAGQPAWLKPSKFAISITIYTLSITWLLSLVRTDRPWLRRVLDGIAWAVIITLSTEIAVIATQVVRGTTSHFNVSTPLDGAMWSVMGLSIMATWIAGVVLAAILVTHRFESPAIAWSVRLGLIIALIGMAQGFLMVSPTAQQMAGWQSGEPVTVVGAHAVGASDIGAGLPLLGWRTDAGDLRIGHFVGMHALQVLPFVGWFVTRRRTIAPWQATRLVWTASATYLAVVVLLTWQALRGQPLLHPDAVTLAASVSIVTVSVGTVWAIMRAPAPSTRDPSTLGDSWEGARA